MNNKYDVEIKDGDNIYVYKDVELEKLETILTEHPNYSEINAKLEKENEK